MQSQASRLVDTATALRNGGTDLHDYVDDICATIEESDPAVRAFVSEPDRRRRLHSAVAEIRDQSPDERPELYGVPVGVKDIIHVTGLETRAGTAVPPELFQGSQAAVVSRLTEAGAVIAGKTVTTEFAGQAPGLTRNPRNLDHTPGGSSSGSAAAVAAGMCPLAIGTQTGGSVIRPAAFCGIIGFKPSFDRIPTDGVIPRAETLDHVGLFTRDVPGMALAASVACSAWNPSVPDRRPTLGVPEGPYLDHATDEAIEAFESQIARLESAGYAITRVRLFEDFEETDRKRGHVADGELALVHGAWFEKYEGFYRTTSADRIRRGRKVTMNQLAEGRSTVSDRRKTLVSTMEDAGIDVWVCPSARGPAPEGITDTGDSVMNRPWTDAGLPAITLPAGTINGLPIGLQCVGRFWTDESLVAWADDLLTAL